MALSRMPLHDRATGSVRSGSPGHRTTAQNAGSSEHTVGDEMADDTSDIEEHLRLASDAIMLLVTEVGVLERHKRAVPPNHVRFKELSEAVRSASETLSAFAASEASWAGAALHDRQVVATIEEADPVPRLTAILEQWRAVERQLAASPPGSPDAVRLFAEFERLRDEYLEAFQREQGRLPGE